MAKRLVNVALFKLYMTYFSVINKEKRLCCKRACPLESTNENNFKKRILYKHKAFVAKFFIFFCSICNAAPGFSHSR